MAIKREAQFGSLFRHWLRANPQGESCAFELKQTTKDSIPFSDVQEHQLNALGAAKQAGILYKAPDDTRSSKPFDFFYLAAAQAYVVIRYPSFFCLIDVDEWLDERQRSARKSLTAARAQVIATLVIKI